MKYNDLLSDWKKVKKLKNMAFVIDFIQIFNFFYFSRNFLNSEINVLKPSFSNDKKISLLPKNLED